MTLPLAALPLGGALLAALTTDAAIGGRVDVMGGVAPTNASSDSVPSVAAIAVPVAALRLAEPNWKLSVQYTPRLLWRTPNDLDRDRPLFLQRGAFDAVGLPSPRLKLRASVRGSAGEIDYIGYALVSNPSVGTAPPPAQPTTPGGAPGNPAQPPSSPQGLNLAVISLYDVIADVSAEAEATERTTVFLPVSAGTSGSLNASSSAYPPHTFVAFAPEVRHELTETDDARGVASVEYHRVTDTDFLAPSLEIGWTHRASSRTTTAVDAGVQYLKTLDDSQPGKFHPIVEALASYAFVQRSQTRLLGTLGASLRNVLYVITVDYRPIATVLGGLDLVVAPRWTAALRASFATTVTKEPIIVGEPETYFLGEAPIRYRANRNVVLEVGVRSLWSAPHLSETFHVTQLQLWGYGAVTLLWGTTPDPQDVVR